MKFKLDENLPVDLAELMRSAGHDAMTVVDQSMGGQADPRVIKVCRDEERTLITLDLDFSDVRTYPPGENAGIVVLRLRRQDKATVFGTMRKLLDLFGTETVKGRLFVVEDDRVRIRSDEN